MSDLKWYKLDPVLFHDETSEMSLEEIGAFAVITNLIMRRDGSFEDNPKRIAKILRCSTRRWIAIRDRLVSLGNLYAVDGFLRNERCDKTLSEALDLIGLRENNGRIAAQKRWGNQIDSNTSECTTTATATTTPTTTTTTTARGETPTESTGYSQNTTDSPLFEPDFGWKYN